MKQLPNTHYSIKSRDLWSPEKCPSPNHLLVIENNLTNMTRIDHNEIRIRRFRPVPHRSRDIAMIQFTCPHCNEFREVSPEYMGQSGPCAQCGNLITIPGQSPPIPGQGPSGPIYQNRDFEPDATTRMLLPVGRSFWAIAAGYLGLLSLIPIFAPIAVVVSIVAIISIKKNPKLHGMGRAIFGLVMGCLMSAFLLLFLVVGLFG